MVDKKEIVIAEQRFIVQEIHGPYHVYNTGRQGLIHVPHRSANKRAYVLIVVDED